MEPAAKNRPSKKQRELLSFIDGFIKGNGYGPSYREIMRALDYKSVSTVAIHVDGLIKKGQLRKRDNSARSLEVVGEKELSHSAKPITSSQQKWLVDQVSQRFVAVESAGVNTRELDNLYVLVGALHILGFDAATVAFKARLKVLTDQLKT